jgi:cobalt-precorrin-7 (C5)-methyltransferase
MLYTIHWDVNFSESEIVDRLVGLLSGNGIDVRLIPGISSIQIAAAYSKTPLDKATILTFHVTGSIEDRKARLIEALKEGRDVILLPRPWDFMPYHIYRFIYDNGIDVSSYYVEIYENLTLKNESITRCRLDELSDRAYSDLCVMVLKHRN